jgi:hypothetical protein
MQKIFPEARDYKTLTLKMTPEAISEIEGVLGEKLDDSEKSEFSLYEIMGTSAGKPGKIGTILALAGKGEYGVIEVVIGVGPNDKIVGAYIQRSREKVTRALQAREFLEQFVGKTKEDALEVGRDLEPASPNAETASRVVALAMKKMLVFNHVLMKGGSR